MSTRSRLSLLVVVAHWVVAISHLFFAANVLPGPDNKVSLMAVVLITLGHVIVSIALWSLGEKAGGWVLVAFFLAASAADLYEHFLHTSPNNIFMVERGGWTVWFDVTVFILLALEILGCVLGILSLNGTKKGGPASRASRV